jgi:hypothetical protein
MRTAAAVPKRDLTMAFLPASHAPTKGTSPRPGFLTRGSAQRAVFPSAAALSDMYDASLPAYSGGTVWASHPLRVAAGVNVELW